MLHFQGWKRSYYTYSTRPPPGDSHAFLVTDVGFIPLRLPASWNIPTFLQLHQLAGETTKYRLGHLSWDMFVDSSQSHSANRLQYLPPPGGQSSSRRDIIARPRLRGEGSGRSPRGMSPNVSSSYCASFSSDFKKCVCPVLFGDLDLLQLPFDGSDHSDRDEAVTLVTVAWNDALGDQDVHSSPLWKTLASWTSRRVCVYQLMRPLPTPTRPSHTREPTTEPSNNHPTRSNSGFIRVSAALNASLDLFTYTPFRC